MSALWTQPGSARLTGSARFTKARFTGSARFSLATPGVNERVARTMSALGALATLSLTPGVAPLRPYSHYHVRVFALLPWARPRFWTWLAVGYAVVVAAVAQHSHAAGGAWPGLSEDTKTAKKHVNTVYV